MLLDLESLRRTAPDGLVRNVGTLADDARKLLFSKTVRSLDASASACARREPTA